MSKISAIANLYNEEEFLDESIQMLKPYVDEFVVINQESTDRTVEIAKKYTDKILNFPRVYYIAYMPQAALIAKNQWVLKWEPDERWDTSILESLAELTEKDYDILRFKVTYANTEGVPSYGGRVWRKDKVIWTDSYDPLVYNEESLKQYYAEDGLITNLRSRASAGNRYRKEGARRLLERYGDTKLAPYANYCNYYKEIISEKVM